VVVAAKLKRFRASGTNIAPQELKIVALFANKNPKPLSALLLPGKVALAVLTHA
jgi:hypothetical protein